jgi:hypothetical protein
VQYRESLTLLVRGPVELLQDDALCPLAAAVYARVRQQPSSQQIGGLLGSCLLNCKNAGLCHYPDCSSHASRLPPTPSLPALNQFALPVLAGLQIKAPQQPLHASPCLEPCAVNMYS